MRDTGERHSHTNLESGFAPAFTFASGPACKPHAHKSSDCLKSPLNVQPQQDKFRPDLSSFSCTSG